MKKCMQFLGAMALVLLFTMLYSPPTTAAAIANNFALETTAHATNVATVYYDVGPPPAIQDGTFLKADSQITMQSGTMMKRQETPPPLALAVVTTTSTLTMATTWQNKATNAFQWHSKFANYATTKASFNFPARTSYVSMIPSILVNPIHLATIAKKISVQIRV